MPAVLINLMAKLRFPPVADKSLIYFHSTIAFFLKPICLIISLTECIIFPQKTRQAVKIQIPFTLTLNLFCQILYGLPMWVQIVLPSTGLQIRLLMAINLDTKKVSKHGHRHKWLLLVFLTMV